ncbi:MAG: type 4a pilus biogenesis protein PilO [Blastocatellia bacterium]|nr:type 4a pilus biogenesis protein PilO [Blastocatellia bacterium]
MNLKQLLPQLGLALVLCLIVYGLAEQFLFGEWKDNLAKQQTQISTLKQKNDATDRFRAERPQLEKELADARTRYKAIETLLPGSENWSQIFEDFKNEARLAGLTITNFDNFHPPYKAGLNEAPLKVALQGKFSDQRAFLFRLAGYPQVIVFREMEISSTDPTGITAMRLSGFVPLDFPTPEAAAAANALAPK